MLRLENVLEVASPNPESGNNMDQLFTVAVLHDFKVVEFQTSSLMNASELERLSTALNLVADEQANGHLLLDFTRVEYLSSQAIGMVVALHKKASSVAGGKLVLCGVGPQLMQLLKITRLDRLLKVVKTQGDAVK
jgi:anti-sigma B factor antagonist